MTGAVDVPRGPDVKHRVRVLAEWLDEGAEIELELPRNLKCAACDGGGCDRCERSGAISIRGRKELGELVRITLPARGADMEQTASGRAIVVRIPERGGMADDPRLPRGLLLLQVVPADQADPGVVRVETRIEPAAVQKLPSEHPPTIQAPARRSRLLLWLTIAVILWISFLIWLRLSGRG